MKVTNAPPLLALAISGAPAAGDLYVAVDPGSGYIGSPAMLIVRAASQTWAVSLPDAEPVSALACMSPERLRTALEYSRPTTRADGLHARDLTEAIAHIIPMAVRQHLQQTKS